MTPFPPLHSVTSRYTRVVRDAADRRRTVTTTVRRVAADATNNPRAADGDVAVVGWDRAGRPHAHLSDRPGPLPGTDGATRTVSWHDWANPDDYWADGKLWTWHTDLVGRLGPAAVVCFVTHDDDTLDATPAWGLADFTATAHAVDTHGAAAVGLAAISPLTVADPADWYPDVAHCADELHRALRRLAAWERDALYRITQRVDDGPETEVLTVYGDDDAWAATQAQLIADRTLDAAVHG